MRRQLLPIVVAVVTVTLAGCGARSNSLDAVVTPAKQVLSQSVFVHMKWQGGAVHAPVYTRGVFAFRTGLGYEAVYLPEVKGQGLNKTFMTFLPEKLYFEPSTFTGWVLPAGKLWVSATLTGPDSVEATFPRFVEQVEGLNPELLLDEIVWGAESVSHAGDTVLNHVPVSEYRVSVNLARALAAATGPSAGAIRLAIEDQLAALRASQPASASQSVSVTVWVDGPGRIVRMQATLPGSGLGTVLIRLTDFGVKFPKSLPLQSQAVDLGSLTPPGGSTPRLPWIFGR